MKTPELKKAPVIGAIYATYEKDPDAAKAFWHEVSRGGEEFVEKAPTTTLDRWLQELKSPEAPQVSNHRYAALPRLCLCVERPAHRQNVD